MERVDEVRAEIERLREQLAADPWHPDSHALADRLARLGRELAALEGRPLNRW